MFKNISEDDNERRRWPTAPKQIMIDNRDFVSGNPFAFTVNFDDIHGRYMDVRSAELKAISFPKVANEMYVVMSIDEINGNMDCLNTRTDQAFAVVFFDCQSMPAGETKAYKGADFYSKRNMLSPSKNLDKMHITFSKYGGGTITPSDTAGQTNVSFIIELSCS